MNRFSFIQLALLLSIGLFSCVSSRQTNNRYYFVQMTDPQFGFFTDNKSFEKEYTNYNKAIDETNRLKPSFLIVTGDLVNKPFDTAQIQAYLSVSNKINSAIPLFNVAGNHDVGNHPSPADIEAYNKIFGKDYYSFTSRSMLGIVLNSLYLTSPEKVKLKAAEQEQWLINLLEETKASRYQHKIVFLHHPLFLVQSDEANGYFNIPIETRKKYLDLFKQYGIKYVFAGHYHRNAFGKNADIEMVTTGPVGKPLGQDPSGFRIVSINGRNLSHRYFNLDSIPIKVKF